MSTIDTSTWNPDPALNESIGDIPLNESASIKQTWQAIQMLMAAGGLHGLQLVVFDGATASADGKQGLVPAPEAGDQDKVLKGDGTWGSDIAGNAATATRLAGPRHSYTTVASAAKNWMRIANASASQIDASKPLHLQFFMRAQASAAGVSYWQSWFVDLECWGNQCGCRVFGNTNAPFSQIRVLYENTAASVDATTRPAVDIYLNYVLAEGTVVEIEEVYNSGFDFVADGQLAVSSAPTGYENRACASVTNGIQFCESATYAYLSNSNISSNTTLNTTSHTRRPLTCTGTVTLTIPSQNSTVNWYLVKNYGSGVVTLHPASSSVYFDGVSADIALQPGEFITLACQSNGHYSIVNDGRWASKLAALESRIAALGG